VNLAIKKFKKVDILINNAAIHGPTGPIENISWRDWSKTIKINLYGSVLMCKALIPHFKKKNKGKIIQLSGGGAASPLPFISSYSVSKAAIVRFVENLSEEVKDYNIDINAVAPGQLNTNMLDSILKAGPKKVGKLYYRKALKQKNTNGNFFRKACEVILFLGSKHSNGISGKLISAKWDNYKNWIKYKRLLKNSDVYTLRRIIGKDRGYRWGDK
jgi:3-oxoacyl-[acyl-carrier protein] reductase